VTDATVGLNLYQTLDVTIDGAPQIALDAEVPLDDFAQLGGIRFGKIPNARILGQLSANQNLLSGGGADAINVGESGFEPLVAGQINASNSCHVESKMRARGRRCNRPIAHSTSNGLLTLPLFVLLDRAADNQQLAVPADDAAIVTTLFYGRSYLHDL